MHSCNLQTSDLWHPYKHPYNAGAEHIGFSPTRWTFLAPSVRRRQEFGGVGHLKRGLVFSPLVGPAWPVVPRLPLDPNFCSPVRSLSCGLSFLFFRAQIPYSCRSHSSRLWTHLILCKISSCLGNTPSPFLPFS